MSLPSSFYLDLFWFGYRRTFYSVGAERTSAQGGQQLNSSSFIFTYRGLFFVVLATLRPLAIGRAAYHYQITNRVSFSPFSISRQIFFDAMLSKRLPQVFVLLYFVLILAAASHYRTTPSEQV